MQYSLKGTNLENYFHKMFSCFPGIYIFIDYSIMGRDNCVAGLVICDVSNILLSIGMLGTLLHDFTFQKS